MSVASIPAPDVRGIELGPLDIRLYGVLIAIGVFVAISVFRRRYVSGGGDPEVAERVALYSVLMGFVGARGAYVLPRLDRFFPENPLGVFAVWEGGLALFGGLVVGTATAVYLLGRWGGRPLLLLDAAAPGVALAQAIGRWGNYFNQELYGTPSDLPWAVEIDPEFRVQEYAEFSTFHPTFLYESLWNIGLAAFLFWVGRRGSLFGRRLPLGAVGLLYFIGYGFMRFLLELLRVETTFRVLGLSRNGWFSLLVVVVASAVLVTWMRRQPAAASESDGETARVQ